MQTLLHCLQQLTTLVSQWRGAGQTILVFSLRKVLTSPLSHTLALQQNPTKTSLPLNGKNILPVMILLHNNTFCHFPIRKFHKKLGQQAWLVAAITVTEFLIVVKYDPNTIMLPIPFFIMQCWFLGILLIFTWTLWRFFIR